ncbi:hypothetical protein EXIGLDRAFT_695253 [Exidia glandulosa HHB12029]|uniref:Protein kinase domain-containing protein n=1 Tax=Exidia glandulosa HHB12029 TaxID=1314781 RepID=A0A165G2Y4_EXIGL|nr:hypothetical protein EXIGLDRAFT_695253 [Exidia glandulosa HHB12029]
MPSQTIMYHEIPKLRDVAVDLHRFHSDEQLIHGQVNMDHVTVSPSGRAKLVKSAKTTAITEQPRQPVNAEDKLPATTATDVYAFAWLVFHVFTGIDPQELVRNDPKIMQLIASGVKPNRPGPNTLPTNRGLDDTIWAMCLRCWEISPIARPTMNEVIKAFECDATTPSAKASSAVPTDVIPSADDMIEKPRGGVKLYIPRRERSTYSLTIIGKPVYLPSYLFHAAGGWNKGGRAYFSRVQADELVLLGAPGLISSMVFAAPFQV